MKTIGRALAAATLAAVVVAPAAHADDYHVPYGFNGHAWNEPLQAFPGLIVWHANTAQNSAGKVTDLRINCQEDQSTGNTCTTDLTSFEQQIQGDGTFALGEYYQKVDSNPWADAGAKVLTISYLYCASERGEYLPNPLRDHLQMCGARIIFTSDTLGQLAKRPEGYRSNFDLVMRKMVAEYGEPPGYEIHGKITVQALDDSDDDAPRSGPPARPEYVVYRWCGLLPDGQQLHPSCPASITLEFESISGVGSVLFATPKVYDFAYARYQMGDQKNDLYALLFSKHLDHWMPRADVHCTGTRICNPGHANLSDKTVSQFAQVAGR